MASYSLTSLICLSQVFLGYAKGSVVGPRFVANSIHHLDFRERYVCLPFDSTPFLLNNSSSADGFLTSYVPPVVAGPGFPHCSSLGDI